MNCYHILFAGYKFGLLNEFAVESLVKLTRGFNLATLIFMNLNSLTGRYKTHVTATSLERTRIT